MDCGIYTNGSKDLERAHSIIIAHVAGDSSLLQPQKAAVMVLAAFIGPENLR